MRYVQEKTQHIWLTSYLGVTRDKLCALMSRLTYLDQIKWLHPVLARKLQQLLKQIEFERDKELEILSEIQAMEERHREKRILMKLEKAHPQYLPPLVTEPASVQVTDNLWQRLTSWIK